MYSRSSSTVIKVKISEKILSENDNSIKITEMTYFDEIWALCKFLCRFTKSIDGKA